MRRKHFCLIILGLLITLSACLPAKKISTTQIPLQLGESQVDLILHESSAEGLTYLNLHDNENTSVRAALGIIKQHGGQVFELKHSGTRNISFMLDGTEYVFDPNRMFSDDGANASLDRFGPVSDSAITAVRSFAETVLDQIQVNELDILVTLHNNDGSGGYSVLSFSPGEKYSTDASQTNINDELDPDDFYYVTDGGIFNDLMNADQNVVLQDNDYVTEDGSLSVWSAQEQLPYVNVEVQDGHRRIQMRMILLLHNYYFLNQDH